MIQALGFDVASETLVGFGEKQGWLSLENKARAIRSCLRGVPKETLIGLEATGGYGLLLAEIAHEMGFTVYVLQPGKVKRFAQSAPSKGKTDKLDAQAIAAYVRSYADRLHPFSPLPAYEKQLRNLYRKKEALTDKLTSTRALLRSLGDSPRQVEATLHGLKARIQALGAQIDELLAQAADAKVLFTIPAVKANLVAAVLPALRTVPFRSKYALDSHAGIDLKPNESGKFKGRRRMSHEGDARLRRAVFMAGLAGASSKVWKPTYERYLNEKKLKPTQALNALGRKILHTVYGVYRTQTPFKAPT